VKLRLGIRQRFVLDEGLEPMEEYRYRPWFGQGSGLYTHESIQVGFGWADIETPDYWSFIITTEVDWP
jgi:hypothetical protein